MRKLASIQRILALNPINDARIGRLSFKVINPEFLLKYGE